MGGCLPTQPQLKRPAQCPAFSPLQTDTRLRATLKPKSQRHGLTKEFAVEKFGLMLNGAINVQINY